MQAGNPKTRMNEDLSDLLGFTDSDLQALNEYQYNLPSLDSTFEVNDEEGIL
jgi:hypothetical protein